MSEQEIQREILHWLNLQPNTLAWRNNSVGVYDSAKKCYRKNNSPFVINSVSDILGISDGQMVAFEVKRPETKNLNTETNKRQRVFIEKIRSLGGMAAVVSSLDEAKKEFECQKRFGSIKMNGK